MLKDRIPKQLQQILMLKASIQLLPDQLLMQKEMKQKPLVKLPMLKEERHEHRDTGHMQKEDIPPLLEIISIQQD